jgi:hypothetical protein
VTPAQPQCPSTAAGTSSSAGLESTAGSEPYQQCTCTSRRHSLHLCSEPCSIVPAATTAS